VVRRQGETLRGCADTATSGSNDLRDAQRAVLEAIADGKADGFRVAEDLSVTDTRRWDVYTTAENSTGDAHNGARHRRHGRCGLPASRRRSTAVETQGLGCRRRDFTLQIRHRWAASQMD
jgi:hypothetical protein